MNIIAKVKKILTPKVNIKMPDDPMVIYNEAPYPAMAIVNYLISNYYPLTKTKLTKIIYYCHGWYLRFYDKPLINEHFMVTTTHGCVILESLDCFNFIRYGNDSIKELGIYFDIRISKEFIVPIIKNEQDIELIKAVWERYGIYPDNQLANATHAENTPAFNIHQKLVETKKINDIIPDELIKEYFMNIKGKENKEEEIVK